MARHLDPGPLEILGVLLVTAGVLTLKMAVNERRMTEIARGKVVDMQRGEVGSYGHGAIKGLIPTIEFVDQDGRTHTLEGDNKGTHQLRNGDEVCVRYDPHNPEKNTVFAPSELLWTGVGITVVGTIIFVVGFAFGGIS